MGKNATQGAAIGSVIGPVGTLIGGQIGAGQDSAEAQAGLAAAQEAEQRATRAAASAAANPSPGEIAAINEAIQLNSQDIERKKKLLASADPALIEAGTQALQLLEGKDAAILSPLKNQRAKERLQLEAQLRKQLGSGYASTTAGIQALSAFDEASNNTYTNAQQQSIGQLLGYTAPISQAGLQSNIQNSQSIASLFGNQSSRAVSAINGTPITAAGSQYAGPLAQAQQTSATIGSLLNLGASLGGAALGNASTAKKNA